MTSYKKNVKRYSLRFYKYFLSYVFILVLVLSILGIVVYRNFILTMQDEVKKSNLFSVMQVRNVMDMRLKEMERIALNISFNNNLKYYNIRGNNYESLEAVRELKKYKSSNEFIYDIALYYNHDENDRIYTTTTSARLDMFFNYIYKYENWGKNDFLDIIDSLNMPTMYKISPIILNNSQKDELATYIYPLAVETVKPYTVVVFFIDKDVIVDILKNALGEHSGYVYIIDRQQNLLFDYANGEIPSASSDVLNTLKTILSRQNVNDIDINGSNYSVANITSDYNGWSYIVARKTNQLMDQVNSSRRMFNYVVISVLILGLITAFAFAVGQYRPWKKLMDNLMDIISSKGMKSSVEHYSDEFEYIIKTITGVSNENINLAKQLKSKSTIIRNQFIMSILNGKPNTQKELQNMEDAFKLDFQYPYFLVMMFLIDDYGSFDVDDRKDMQDLAIFSIINVTEELSQEFGQGYGVELPDGRGVALLLNIKYEYKKERYISELAFKTKDFFTKYFGFTLTVGIGNIYNRLDLIHESFLEANRAVYYRLIKGYGNVIFYENIKERQKQMYKYPVELEEELIMAIKSGKSDDIRTIVLNIKEYITNNSMTIEAVQCVCFGIINSIMKVLSDINIDTSQCFKNEEEILFAQPFETIDNLVDRIIGFCSTICHYVQEQKESRNFELREKILAVVEENFMDSSLSLDSIASKFNMSSSYISRYFKDQTGYSLMQYVDMLRMNEVKRLLKDTDIPLKDIISQVGYIDRSSFYRKFKKREGITPTEYRSIVKGM